MHDPHDAIEDYLRAVQGRLDKGEREYGDTGFSKPVSRLAFEITEEAEDVGGWGYMTWCRALALRRKAIVLEKEIERLEAKVVALRKACGED